ncbi:hypothetical protein pb186bvf_020197 [Paramecium bursaria]
MNHDQMQDQQYIYKTELQLEGKIERIQPYKDNLISFYIDKLNSIYIFNPKNQKIERTIQMKAKLDFVRHYIIKEELNYIILNEFMDWLWRSKCYKLSEGKMYPQVETQIIGIWDQVIIVFYLLVAEPSMNKIELRKINLYGEILFKRNLIITQSVSHHCFETSFIIFQYDLYRIWVFLKNNRRIQVDFNYELDQPNQNFSHNRNYYLFGYYVKRCVNFVVRQNAQFKIIRKVFLKHQSAKAKQIGEWLYIRDFDCKTNNSPLTRVNLTNCSIQKLYENKKINSMARTNNSKYLTYSVENTLHTVEMVKNDYCYQQISIFIVLLPFQFIGLIRMIISYIEIQKFIGLKSKDERLCNYINSINIHNWSQFTFFVLACQIITSQNQDFESKINKIILQNIDLQVKCSSFQNDSHLFEFQQILSLSQLVIL